MSIVKRIAALALVSAAFAAPAGATVINFNNLAGTAMPNAAYSTQGLTQFNIGNNATVDGFNFISSNYEYLISSTYYGNTAAGPRSYNGTDFLLAFNTVTMTRANDSSFAVRTIDLSSWEGGSQNVVLTGTKTNGNIVTSTLSISGLNSGNADFTNFELVGFQSLRSLVISGTRSLAIDNISDTADASLAPGVVPEPGTLAVFGLGLAGLALVRRRKQQ